MDMLGKRTMQATVAKSVTVPRSPISGQDAVYTGAPPPHAYVVQSMMPVSATIKETLHERLVFSKLHSMTTPSNSPKNPQHVWFPFP